jgi:hypothetical protein
MLWYSVGLVIVKPSNLLEGDEVVIREEIGLASVMLVFDSKSWTYLCCDR